MTPSGMKHIAVDLLSDLGYELRQLVRLRTMSVAIIGSLALGVGITSGIVGVLQVTIWKPLPFQDASSLWRITSGEPNRRSAGNPMTREVFTALRNGSRSTTVAIYRWRSLSFVDEATPERVDVMFGSDHLLEILGLGLATGRYPAGEEFAGREAVLDHSFWQRAFGDDSSVLGKSIYLDGVPFEVVGILAEHDQVPGFEVDIWTDLISLQAPEDGLTPSSFWGLGRSRQNAGREEINLELNRALSDAGLASQQGRSIRIEAVPLADGLRGSDGVKASWAAGVAAFLILVIACLNATAVLMARGRDRHQEMAIRAAIGAGRGRLVRQSIAGGVLMVGLAAIISAGVAAATIGGLNRFILVDDPVTWTKIAVDRRFLLASLVMISLAVVMTTIQPARRASKPDTRRLLSQSAAARTGSGMWFGRLLIVSDVALSTILLGTTVLLLQTLLESRRVDLGVDLTDLHSAVITPPQRSDSSDETESAFHSALLDRFVTVPGLTGTGAASGSLLGPGPILTYTVDGDEGSRRIAAQIRSVSESFGEVVGLQLVAGRWLDRSLDVPGSENVVVVNRALAEARFSSVESSVGRRLRVSDTPTRIVGVVESIRSMGPADAVPHTLYQSLDQWPARSVTYFFRAEGQTIETTARQLRLALQEIDGHVALGELRSVEAKAEEMLALNRALTAVLFVLGGVALVLTISGTYGVAAYVADRRRHELGVRMAMGAGPARAVGRLVADSVRPILLGLGIGSIVTLAIGFGLRASVSGIDPIDGPILLVSAALILGSTVVASLVPSVRAARADLRQSIGA